MRRGRAIMAKILHIEDDERSRRLVRKLLEGVGHQVVDAVSGLEAIATARRERPDLVLVDIDIPELDGYEIILRLRGIAGFANLPIVAITDEGNRDTSLAVGADGFIAKPFEARDFVSVLGSYLRGRRDHSIDATEPRLREQSQRIVQRLENKVRELSAANARLEEMARLRRDFLRNVTHELATPLTPIVGYLGLLERGDLGPLNPAQKKSISAMLGSIRKLRSTVDTLLDVSAIESGQIHFQKTQQDLVELLRRAVNSLAHIFKEGGTSIFIDEEELPEFPIIGDPDKIERALGHILENAIKFSDQGGAIGIAFESIDGVHSILILDDGEGIPEERKSAVFEPFVQIDSSVTRKHGGTGLGLAYARRIAEAHGGDIHIESAAGRSIGGHEFRGSLIKISFAAGP